MKIIFLTIILVTTFVQQALGQQEREPWREWLDWLPSAPVSVNIAVSGASSPAATASFAGKSVNVAGEGDCDAVASVVTALSVNLKPMQTYQFTISGGNWKVAQLTFEPKANLQGLGKSQFSSVPKPLKIYVNGQDISVFTNVFLFTNATCAANSATFTVQMKPVRGLRPAQLMTMDSRWEEEPDNNPHFAPGDGTIPKIGPGVDLQPWRGAARWGVSIGKMFSGQSAGLIRWYETQITTNSWASKSLAFTARTTNTAEINVITNAQGALRQIRAPQALADIQETNSETAIRFYLPSQVGTLSGTYALSGNPFATWKIKSGTGGANTNWVQIVEERPNAITNVHDIRYDAAAMRWSATSGSGTDKKVEARALSISGKTRQETVQVHYTSGNNTNDVYKAVEAYAELPWGWELTNVVVNPGTYGLTNRFVFETNTNSPAYGKLSIKYYPGGSWEKRVPESEYPMWIAPTEAWFKPWLDGPIDPISANVTNSVFEYIFGWPGYMFQRASHYNSTWYPYADAIDVYAYMTFGGFTPNAEFPIREVREQDWVSTLEGPLQREETDVTRLWFPNNGMDGLVAAENIHNYGTTKDGRALPKTIYEYDLGAFNPTTHTFSNSSTGLDMKQVKYTIYTPNAISKDIPASPNPYLYSRYYVGQFGFVEKYSTMDVSYYLKGNVVLKEYHILEAYDGTTFTWALVNKQLNSYDSLGHLTNTVVWDGGNSNKARVTYSAEWRSAGGADWDLLTKESDQAGVTTTFKYDSLKRLTNKTVLTAVGSGIPGNIEFVTKIDAYGRTLRSETIGADSTVSEHQTFDLAGRPITFVATNGIVTNYLYSSDTRSTSSISNGKTNTTTTYLDGRLKSITGNAVVSRFYSYDVPVFNETTDTLFPIDPGTGYVGLWEEEMIGAASSARRLRKGYNTAGKRVVEILPTLDTNLFVTNFFVYDRGFKYEEIRSVVDAAGDKQEISTVYYPDAFGGNTQAGTVLGKDWWVLWGESLDPGGSASDRMVRTITCFENASNSWFMVRSNFTYLKPFDATETLLSVEKVRLSGFASNNVCFDYWIREFDGGVTTRQTVLERSDRKKSEIVQSVRSNLASTNVWINGYLVSSNSFTITRPTVFAYDSLGRILAITDPEGFKETCSYNSLGYLDSVSDRSGARRLFGYYATNHVNAGLLSTEINALGKATYRDYNTRGQLTAVWGDVPIPERRVYSNFGELVELQTFRAGANWNAAAWPSTTGPTNSTFWTFDERTGWLIRKADAAGRSTTNTYWPTGLLKATATAEGRSVTNFYSEFGDLARIAHSNPSLTPDILFDEIDRGGRPHSITDGTGVWQLSYDDRGRAILETNSLIGIQRFYHPDQGLTNITLSANDKVTNKYAYDSLGRLASVSNGLHVANYGYRANADLIATTMFSEAGANKLVTSREWEFGSRFKSINNVALGSTISSHVYLYDGNNRITSVLREQGTTWRYDYDDRDQLISAQHYWPDLSLVSGQSYQFVFDNGGNRTSAFRGSGGSGLRKVEYAVNDLNQYTTILTPGYRDVYGVALSTASVTVNTVGAGRKDEYYHREVPILNGTGPVWQNVQVSTGAGSANGGFVFPKETQSVSYDLNGNIIFDGIWAYTWDDEDRLKEMVMTNIGGIINAKRKKVVFNYDYRGRRSSKIVSTWTGSGFSGAVTNRYVYDDWKLLAEVEPSGVIVRSYTWGLDVFGSTDRGAGSGALVLVTDHVPATNVFYYPAYDANGNVMALVAAADQSVAARYEYSPFGEVTRMTGNFSKQNPFRWSTKFADEESGLVYYGRRFYSPELGRWINRDPKGEAGGINLLMFCRNQPTMGIDALGCEFSLTGALTSSAIGGILGGITSAAFGGDFVTGAAIGGLGGLAGYGATALASAYFGTGVGGAIGPAAMAVGAFADGAVATSLSLIAQTGDFSKLATAEGALAVAAIGSISAIIGGAGGAISAAHAQIAQGLAKSASGADEIALDLTLAIAGTLGVGAADAAYSLISGLFELAEGIGGNYTDQLDGQ